MGKAENRQKSQKMAEDMKKRGIWHGRRMTSTNAPTVPNFTDVGSAAYRRLPGYKKGK